MLSTDQIVTQFRAVGQSDVTRAFAGISAAAKTADASVGSSGAVMSGALKSAAAVAVVAAATVAGALAGIGAASVKAAASVQFLDAGFKTVFGSSANAAIAKLTEFSKILQREDDEVKALGLRLANLGVRPDLPTLSGIYGAARTSAAMSGKPEDIFGNAESIAQLLGKIVQLNSFGGRDMRAMMGQNIPPGAIKQMMAEMGLSEDGGRKLTGQQAVEGIIAALNRMYGGANATSANTLAEKLNQLKYTFQDMLENIGAALIPTVSMMLDNMRKLVLNAGDTGRRLADIVHVVAVFLQLLHSIWKIAQMILNVAGGVVGGLIAGQWAVTMWLAGQIMYGLGWLAEKLTGWAGLKNTGKTFIDTADRMRPGVEYLLSPSTYVKQWNDYGKSYDQLVGDTLKSIEAGLRSMKNGTMKSGLGDPFANITPPGVTPGENGTVSNAITEMVRRFIIGGGQFATAWARQLDLPGGGRATGTATVPIKLTPESADLQARANAAVGTDILTSILNNPAAVRLLKQKLATAP